MVTCPKCGEEVRYEDYEAHYEICQGDTDDLAKKASVTALTGRLLTPFQEEMEERAKKLGFKDLRDYEIHKEVAFDTEHRFDGVLIYPLDQVQLIGDFSYAIANPESLPTGMQDPVDSALSTYLPIIWNNSRFIGFADKKRHLRDDKFPCGAYERDYRALKQLLSDNGWVKTGDRWRKA